MLEFFKLLFCSERLKGGIIQGGFDLGKGKDRDIVSTEDGNYLDLKRLRKWLSIVDDKHNHTPL